MRVEEGRKGWNLLAVTLKSRAVVERGEESLLSGPESESCPGREKEKNTKAKTMLR